MSKNLAQTLSWGQRFALIDAFSPDTNTILETFGVTNDEFETAQEMLAEGSFKVDTTFDTKPFATKFDSVVKPSAAKKTAPEPISKPQSPRTATKTVVTKKPRGRQGSKIAEAFAAIPSEAVPAEAFADSNSVSLHVLRQAKRFDKSGLTGDVRVKKDKETKMLMIWRENAE